MRWVVVQLLPFVAGWAESGPRAAGLRRLVLGQSESFKEEGAELQPEAGICSSHRRNCMFVSVSAWMMQQKLCFFVSVSCNPDARRLEADNKSQNALKVFAVRLQLCSRPPPIKSVCVFTPGDVWTRFRSLKSLKTLWKNMQLFYFSYWQPHLLQQVESFRQEVNDWEAWWIFLFFFIIYIVLDLVFICATAFYFENSTWLIGFSTVQFWTEQVITGRRHSQFRQCKRAFFSMSFYLNPCKTTWVVSLIKLQEIFSVIDF